MGKISIKEMEAALMGIGCNSENRWQVFMSLFDTGNLDEEALNWGFHIAYTNGRVIKLDDVEKVLPLLNLELVSGEEGMNFYNSLPDVVTLYRGTSEEECNSMAYGFSWTTDVKVAKFFAYRHTTKNRCVVGIDVEKKDIKAVFVSRDESECLIDVVPYLMKNPFAVMLIEDI